MKCFTAMLALILLLSGCGGGGDSPRPPDGRDMEALRRARAAAAEAEAAAMRARDAAAAALAGAEANRDADPASFALAQSAAAAAGTAYDTARAAAAQARAATTLAEAQRHRDAAEAALRRGQAALADVRRHAAAVTDAHRRRAAEDMEALRRARAAVAEAEAAAMRARDAAAAALAGAEANRDADPASFALAQSAAAAAGTAYETARAAAAKARAATTVAEAQRHRDDAVAALDTAQDALEEVRRYAGMVDDAHRRASMAMEALRRAKTAATEAANLAMESMEFARTVLALAEAEGNKYADPTGIELARRAVEAAEAAYRAAKAAAEMAQAATTVGEAQRHRDDAHDGWQRASAAALEAKTYADRVLAARAVAESPELRLAPVFESGGRTNMGARTPPPAAGFRRAGTRNGVGLSTGTVRDGASAADVLEYLLRVTTNADASVVGLGTLLDQPVVRLVEGTDRESADLARRAIRIINAALPYDKRVEFDRRRVPAPADSFEVSEGYIAIQFSPPEDWPYLFDAYPAGVAFVRAAFTSNHERQREEVVHGQSTHVLINTTVTDNWPEAVTLHVLVHELIHALGLVYHTDPDRFPGSTLSPFVPANLPAETLALVDRDALLAAYSRFTPGTLPEDMTAEGLGPWEDATFHLRGDLDAGGASVSFGVGLRNGLGQPWASGPTPGRDLADNRALSGSATWTGALLGVSRPDNRTVAGNARLALELATLDGQLDFTGLEQWGAKEAPGAAGVGATWGDGDLGYTVRVSGNAFVRTGGDAGDLTGAFFGSGHEGMGGVLERDDLAAGFGGKR